MRSADWGVCHARLIVPVLCSGANSHHETLFHFHPDGSGKLDAVQLGELKAVFLTYALPSALPSVP